jgi:hypothetical protein
VNARRVATVVALLFVVGCGSCDEDEAARETAAAVAAREPVPPPDGMTFEASLFGGAETLREARRFVGRHPARFMMPDAPGELVERMVSEDIGLAERVADDAALHAVGVEEGWVLAVPIQTDDDPAHPLGSDVPTVAGAPEGAVWVGRAPEGDLDEAVALAGDVLVLSERSAALREALPYAAFTLAAADPPDASEGPVMRAKLARELPGQIRQLLEALIEGAMAEELGRIREEREEHDEAPDFGEPEAVVEHAARFARTWLAYLPDLEESELALVLDAGTAKLTLRASVREGSPLAVRLAETPAGGVDEIAALPRNTAFAVSTRSAPDAAERFSFLEAFHDIAGERLSAGEQSALEALSAAWDEARGPETLVAAGGGAEDAWLVASLPAPRDALEQSALARVFGARFSASLLGILFDCPRPPRPRFGAALCPGAPTLSFARSEARTVFGLARGGSAAATVADGEGARLAAEPDVERALSALGDELIFAMVIFPSRIMPLGGLSGSEPLQRLSRVSALAARPAPMAMGIGRDEGELVMTVVASDRAIEDAVGLAGSF